jgi:16S rRNA processing protein RimM
VTEWFNVGKIVNTHGIKGEVRVISRTDFPEKRYAIGSKLYLFNQSNKQERELIVKTYRRHKQFDLLSFEGFPNINDVEPFKGSLLKVHEDQLGELDEGEYYYHEIIGCDVFSEEEEKIGVVKDILSPGANDVWVVRKEGSTKEVYIPYIEDVVKEIDIANQRITIHIMEGLL